MNHRYIAPLIVLTVFAAWLTPAVEAQARQGRTPWGDPDLQGVYTFSTLTPMERPLNLTNKGTLTPEELAAQERENAARIIREATVEEGDTGT
jgi:hypothetical protein